MFSGERTGVHWHACMSITHLPGYHQLQSTLNPKPCTSTALQDGNSEVARKYILDALQGASHLPSLMDEYAPPLYHRRPPGTSSFLQSRSIVY
jgi:hypothetical protein